MLEWRRKHVYELSAEIGGCTMHMDDLLRATRDQLSSGSPTAAVDAEASWRRFLAGDLSDRDRKVALGRLGELLAMQGKLADAEDCFEQAISVELEPSDMIIILCGYANLLCGRRRVRGYEHVVAGLLGAVSAVGDAVASVAPWGYAYLAHFSILAGNLDEALSHAERAVSAATALKPARGLAEAWTAMSHVHEAAGRTVAAMECLEEAMVAMGEHHCLMEARARHGRLALAMGDTEQAVISFTKAVEFSDLRDRRVLGEVLRDIAALCRSNPELAAELTERLAARLYGSTQ
jgi:tetratricopeptide (TPR) repeat protein